MLTGPKKRTRMTIATQVFVLTCCSGRANQSHRYFMPAGSPSPNTFS